MAGVIKIPAGERGVIRIFDLDMAPEQARFLREPGALAQVLGIDEIDLDHVEIFPISDLEELGLAGYLTQGCGLAEAEIAADRKALTALEGHILLLRSRAFGGKATHLTPASQIRPIASYGETPVNWSAPPMSTPESSKPYSAPKTSPRDARNAARRIGATLFAIVMSLVFLILYLLVF
ncbi:hypothetical protein [Phaeobacter sp. 11ANDIMAR09]|uniref:hypothetical protein n=1 Tax=Phaeobacter sp. 11ANDIMAR09 TaxID=1225647 RepID=UPI0006C8D383|nr:hypothetical protein [Phaeobacter sp. 11ANDIMAR09]KPD13488.1 hypothetical protein AN476_04665 [Phaeobacter sp. 11ANDIMAR09]OIQ35021.1 MAG: hypothetical protein BM559_03440 [Roseobacter sp. MedPE-SWchi]